MEVIDQLLYDPNLAEHGFEAQKILLDDHDYFIINCWKLKWNYLLDTEKYNLINNYSIRIEKTIFFYYQIVQSISFFPKSFKILLVFSK